MTFNTFQGDEQGAYWVVLIVSAMICMIAIALRFIATRQTRRKPALEDWLALSAVLVFLLRVAVVLYALNIINGRDLNTVAVDTVAFEKVFKMVFLADLITPLDQTLAKFSILALYHRIFGVKRTFVYWIWFLGAFQGAVYIMSLFLQVYQCHPVEKFWKWWVPGTCIKYQLILVSGEPPNSIIDFFLVILAMFMIRSLQISRGTKWKLFFLFGIGSLAGIFGFIKIGLAYSPTLTNTSAVLGLWAAVQSVACIVCCCAPVYKPLLPETGLWSRLTSKVSSLGLATLRTKPKSASGSAISGSKTDAHGGGEPHSSSETGSQHSQSWLRMDGSSNKGLAWAEPRAKDGGGDAELGHTGESTYPMGAIKVNRTVDVV